MRDAILEELWLAKNQLAAETGYDMKKLFERLRTATDTENRKVVDRSSSGDKSIRPVLSTT